MRFATFLLTAAFTIIANADEPKTKPDPVKQAPRVLKPAEAGVGRLIPDVVFSDLSGKVGKLSDFRTAKLTVVAFTSTSCPISKKYTPSLARLEKDYTAKGVAFLFINPIATDTPDAKAFAGRNVHDTDGKLTAAFSATATTEVFVLDSTRTVVYCGAVDDQYGLGYSRDQPRNRYLAVAIDEALAGKLPFTAATEAPGCTLEPDPQKIQPVAQTYHARIERIVQANCIECHRAGGVAPFSLEKYEDVVSHKGIIKNVVERGTMPPWFATASAKGQHSAFANDRSLTENDKKDLLAWFADDLKKGDPSEAPLSRKYDSGWLIGKPDAVFQIPKPIAVKAEGTMPYQNVTVETNLDEDKWVQALEVQPTAREVVHHVLVHAIPKGAFPLRNPGAGALRPAAEDGRDEAQGFFAIYVPGNSSLIYPEGYAKKLPKGCTLRFQIHYTPNGKATSDQTKFGMVFAKEPPRHEVKVFGIINRSFEIPAGNDNYKVSASITVPFDAHILAFAPHMHLRGKAARYELKTQGTQTATLLDVPHYDFNWQLLYRFAAPVFAPRGSNLSFTAWYDNSEGNPANPDPKKTVKWGQQTYDEMHLGYVEYFVDGPGKGQAADGPKAAVKIPPGGVEIPEAFKAIFKK
ncbi:MAG TPA: redoxin family protein, partial [Gemmata sp.]|nr:redoxin family protein [Gemmata sp.]